MSPANEKLNREELFRAHGRLIDKLAGSYITAEDVGTTTTDMEWVHSETGHVAGLKDRSGDPSAFTARGVLRGMEASAKHYWGSEDLNGRTVILQGCGNVAYCLAKALWEAGAELFACDIDSTRAQRVVEDFGATSVSVDDCYDKAADFFAPCALGAILNDTSVPKLKAQIVCGCANNQLANDLQASKLHDLRILYAPDYVVNAGGVINGCTEILGWTPNTALERLDAIRERLAVILQASQKEETSPVEIANRLVYETLDKGFCQLQACTGS